MKKSQLYTATGDQGTTSLIGGQRIDKSAPRIEAYGTVDELNSHIGLLAAHMAGDQLLAPRFPIIQSRLFDIGSSLATPPSPDTPPSPGVDPSDIAELESLIDEVDAALPPFRCFVLPGGSIAASEAHVARTVCRRAERRVIALSRLEPVDPAGIIYLNRLSDLLFAVARRCNVAEGCPEVIWHRRRDR